jgi:hypothetical protein
MFKSYLIVSILASLFLFSCKKNDETDPNAVSSGNMITDSIGGCKNVLIHGSYNKDTALTADNYLDVSVNVRTAGNYTIETNTVNGMVFKGTGRLGYGGANIVRLYGSGTPIANALSPMKVKYGSSLCTANISVGTGATGTAIYSMGGAPNSCTGFNLTGTWQAGQIIQAGVNNVVMNVNVTAVGIYQINIAAVNGVSFTGSGIFNTLGVQSIALSASGTPVNSGAYNYVVSSNTTNCTFSINYL